MVDRIRMQITVVNETTEVLGLRRQHHDVGSWTNEWRPPAEIAPGESREFRSEGDAFVVGTTGTEGEVRFGIGADPGRELRIKWTSALVESAYGNTFQVHAPPGYEAATTGGQGRRATLLVRLRPSALRTVAGFDPGRHGFAFPNRWSADLPVVTVGHLWNRLLAAVPDPLGDLLQLTRVDENWLPVTRADTGLCGGMVFAAMDHWYAGSWPTTRRTSPDRADDPLYVHLRRRLVDSFDITGGGHRFLSYSSPHYPNGDEGVLQATGLTAGRSWVSYREEWPKIRADVDAGRLSPLGLIQTDSLDIGANHTVLVYGYQQSGQQVVLHLYDPNRPGRTCTLTFDLTSTQHAVRATKDPPERKRVFAFFRIDGYRPEPPPPGRRRAGRAVALRTHQQIDEVTVLGSSGADQTVRTSYFPASDSSAPGGSGWAPWYVIGDLAAGPAGGADLVAVRPRERPDGTVSVFGWGPDGVLRTTHWPAGEVPGWAPWHRVDGPSFGIAAPLTAVAQRPADGALSVFAVDRNGHLWTACWPAPTGPVWSGWVDLDAGRTGVLHPGGGITALVPRATPAGATAVYAVGAAGAVLTRHWPSAGGWGAWVAISGADFVPGGTVAAIRPRLAVEGSVSLFTVGQDGRVWSAAWPSETGGWQSWYPIGDPLFRPGGPVTALRTREHPDGVVSVYAVGQDGLVWTAYYPDDDSAAERWSGWGPIGTVRFPPDAAVAAVRPRREPEGAVSLFVTGDDGRVWSAYWPLPGTPQWSEWEPVGDQRF